MRLSTTVDDSPKLRLALAVFIALIVWLAFLFALGHWLVTTRSEPAPEKALEMRVVELDPEPPTHTAPKSTPTPTPTQTQTRTPTPTPPPALKPSRPVTPGRPALPETPTPARHAADTTTPVSKEPGPSAESPASTSNSADEKQSTSPPATSPGDSAARSIAQPLPALPDDLREQAYQTVATARFVIHVDGSVDVELIKPTPDPRLNQLLLEALRKWRFFPALQGGRPVESRQDVRVHFNVN
ncbi:hypothetical protein DR64_6217 [Paraburkholderia xenovorans LB400]|uniref:Outer membrane transport energization protein TonB n=2 Tax=Paraburkholderia xenovorans TaxID=36873 RepID=Q13LI2_PARXL|nr:outer membrane transport energization protein TonB [Paraburkholderia xenovorans LB400]AIP35264.1 hypothetical protein DR64_6217 [Paraburkholderia xenovorans LB400]